MKFGSLIKKSIIGIVLLVATVTVIPLVIMILNITEDGYESSFLKKMFEELES